MHAFYYLWYGRPAVDGRYLHWDHEVLPHWTPAVNREHAEVTDRQTERGVSCHSMYVL